MKLKIIKGQRCFAFDIIRNAETLELVAYSYNPDLTALFAAVPLLRDALYDALAYIDETARIFGVEPDRDAWERMINALQVELLPAAKGE